MIRLSNEDFENFKNALIAMDIKPCRQTIGHYLTFVDIETSNINFKRLDEPSKEDKALSKKKLDEATEAIKYMMNKIDDYIDPRYKYYFNNRGGY